MSDYHAGRKPNHIAVMQIRLDLERLTGKSREHFIKVFLSAISVADRGQAHFQSVPTFERTFRLLKAGFLSHARFFFSRVQHGENRQYFCINRHLHGKCWGYLAKLHWELRAQNVLGWGLETDLIKQPIRDSCGHLGLKTTS